jgi:hypothetical protein
MTVSQKLLYSQTCGNLPFPEFWTRRRKGAVRQSQNRNGSAGLTAEARRMQRKTKMICRLSGQSAFHRRLRPRRAERETENFGDRKSFLSPVLSFCVVTAPLLRVRRASAVKFASRYGLERVRFSMSYCVSFTASHNSHSRFGCAGLEACCPGGWTQGQRKHNMAEWGTDPFPGPV